MLAEARGGSIVLLHDGPQMAPARVAAILDGLLPRLAAQGLECVTVSEFLHGQLNGRAAGAEDPGVMTGAPASVVIPVFNGARYLGEAVASVLAQTYRPVEVIVVDDGLTDGSAAVARSFRAVRVLEQERGGPAVARNAGAAAATGEFLAFHDADDLLPPDKLERQIGHLLEHPEVGCVLGRQELMLEPGVEMPEWAKLAPEFAERRPDLVELGAVPLISMVMRRSLFVESEASIRRTSTARTPTTCSGRERAPVVTLDSVVLMRRRPRRKPEPRRDGTSPRHVPRTEDHARRLRAGEEPPAGRGLHVRVKRAALDDSAGARDPQARDARGPSLQSRANSTTPGRNRRRERLPEVSERDVEVGLDTGLGRSAQEPLPVDRGWRGADDHERVGDPYPRGGP